MTEAPHGTAPALEGKNIANPMAMILAVGAILHHVGGARRTRSGGARRRAPSTSRCSRHRRGRAHARHRRARDHDRVHRRGDRPRAHEDRDLVEPLSAGAGGADRRCVRPLRRRVSSPCEDSRRAAGPPLVLAHGLTATRRYVVHGSRALERAGYRVISYDARGHGESDPAPDPARTPTASWSPTSGRARRARHRARRARGASMGAATTLAFALAHPERVAALVQITPAYVGAARPIPSGSRTTTRSPTGSSATESTDSCAPSASRRSRRASRASCWRRSGSASSDIATPRRSRRRCGSCLARARSMASSELEWVAAADARGRQPRRGRPRPSLRGRTGLCRADPERRARERGAGRSRRSPGGARGCRGRSRPSSSVGDSGLSRLRLAGKQTACCGRSTCRLQPPCRTPVLSAPDPRLRTDVLEAHPQRHTRPSHGSGVAGISRLTSPPRTRRSCSRGCPRLPCRPLPPRVRVRHARRLRRAGRRPRTIRGPASEGPQIRRTRQAAARRLATARSHARGLRAHAAQAHARPAATARATPGRDRVPQPPAAGSRERSAPRCYGGAGSAPGRGPVTAACTAAAPSAAAEQPGT